MRLLPLFILMCINSFAQNIRMMGIGAQVFEPTGVNVQLYKGFFSMNNSMYATYGVWELALGIENATGIVGPKKYASGNWNKGGIRMDLNYLHPILTIKSPLVLQTYLGAGLQTGTRKYQLAGRDESNFSTGANFMVRVEWVAHGFDIGPGKWFLSFYADIKYHKDFSESFDYISPVLGARMRRGK